MSQHTLAVHDHALLLGKDCSYQSVKQRTHFTAHGETLLSLSSSCIFLLLEFNTSYGSYVNQEMDITCLYRTREPDETTDQGEQFSPAKEDWFQETQQCCACRHTEHTAWLAGDTKCSELLTVM